MPIEVVKENLLRRIGSCLLQGSHKTLLTVAHPRTGAMAEVIYAGHSLTHADSKVSIAIYVMLLIVALAHCIIVHHMD